MTSINNDLLRKAKEITALQLSSAEVLLEDHKFDTTNERNMAIVILAQALATNLATLANS